MHDSPITILYMTARSDTVVSQDVDQWLRGTRYHYIFARMARWVVV